MKGPYLAPGAKTSLRAKQIQEAKDTQNAIEELADAKGTEAPPYEFLELIGKGTFGRVFKSKDRRTQEIVAVKVVEVDKADYEIPDPKHRDDSIKDLMNEISILQQLKDSKAKNINVIHEAFSFSSQLWIVSEWCPGGSVHTLMKATPEPGLEERFIIPVARELAVALQYVHQANIIHRDIKCGNILVTEDGHVQLCDFGVAGILESDVGKRTTIVGTPYWMPPELHTRDEASLAYGVEVDCWGYGCTIYEMATGLPPNAKTTRPHLLSKALQRGAPRLEGDRHSQGLCEFVAFCLEERPRDRPSAGDILQHPYIANTQKQYPTESLRELIERYALWEQAGGVRASLFNPLGAAGPDIFPSSQDEDDSWNFSTTDEFDRQFAGHNRLSDPFTEKGDALPGADKDTPKSLTPYEKALKEQRIKRGGMAMERLFNRDAAPYTYNSSDGAYDQEHELSDLPLRNHHSFRDSNRITMIDLDMASSSTVDVPTLDLDVETIRASRQRRWFGDDDDDDEEEEEEEAYYGGDNLTKRATRDWKFPVSTDLDRPNRRTQDWTFPKMEPEPEESASQPSRSSQIASRRRATKDKDLRLPILTAPADDNRRTMDFTFPAAPDDAHGTSFSDQGPSTLQPSPLLGPGFRPHLRHAVTEPIALPEGVHSAPDSPARASMIDLDDAYPTEIPRPPTAGSVAESTYTTNTDITSANPFDLEDQVQFSQKNNRTSFHMKSQSEPPHQLPGLLTPSDRDPVPTVPPHLRQANQQHNKEDRRRALEIRNWNHAIEELEYNPPASNNHHHATSVSHSAASMESGDPFGNPELWEGFDQDTSYPWRSQRSELAGSGASSTTAATTGETALNLTGTTLDPSGTPHLLEINPEEISSAPPRPGVRAPAGPGGRLTVDFPRPRPPSPEAFDWDADHILVEKTWRRQLAALIAGFETADMILKAVGPGTDRGKASGSESGSGGSRRGSR